MTNLEKLTNGEIAAKNNGTLEQLREVLKHCFPKDLCTTEGSSIFYYKSKKFEDGWYPSDKTYLPTINITQLWEELQALKAKGTQPEIWWIRVTSENIEVLKKWYPNKSIRLRDGYIVGYYAAENTTPHYGFTTTGSPKGDSYDFGNEIDFETFLRYTGETVETKEEILPEWVNETETVEVKEKALDEKLKVILELNNERLNLSTKKGSIELTFYQAKNELENVNTKLSEIETKISSLLK